MAKTDQRVLLTKRLLKEALIRLLKEKNIYKITIRELCDEAGINRSTFYKYYDSQFDLLAGMEEEFLNSINNSLSDNITAINRKDTDVLVMILSILSENVEFSRLLINNNIDPDFPIKLIYSPQIQKYLNEALALKYNKETVDYAATFITFGGYYMLQQWINKDNKRESVEEMSILLNEFFMLMILKH